MITRAREAGVGVMQTICTEMAEFNEVRGIAQRYEGVYCSVGVHPNDSGQQELVSLQELISKTSHKEVIGIGETGLDYYYEKTDRELQKQSFLTHIIASRETNLPIIVHTRDAEEDTVNIMQEQMGKGAYRGVIHCFTSTQYLAEKALEMGFYISISGIISFKTAQAIRDVVKTVPLDRLLVETDAPFLAPVPNRGKRNEPSFVPHTNKVVAEIKEISPEECARITTENFFRLFNKAAPVVA